MKLQAKAFALRKVALNMVYTAKCGHIGGDLSVMDILLVLYHRHLNISPQSAHDPDRDRFILSKGHSVEALYAVLCDRGFFPPEDLTTFSRFGSNYIGHPTNKVKGIEMNSGSLGHGLPVAAGMALAAKLDGRPYRVYTVMGDGELAEGSVWEAAMLASHYRLDNLIGIVDHNGLQISGSNEAVLSPGNLWARWKSFGWQVLECDGNDIDDLDRIIGEAKKLQQAKPVMILAHTTKGCGVSFMENQVGWHHRVPTLEEYKQAMSELSAKEVDASGR